MVPTPSGDIPSFASGDSDDVKLEIFECLNYKISVDGRVDETLKYTD